MSNWGSKTSVPVKKYVCPWCGSIVSSAEVYVNTQEIKPRSYNGLGKCKNEFIYICPNCQRPTYFNFEGQQTPNIKYGDNIKNISNEFVNTSWEEARVCMQVNSYTSAVLMCRKIIMNAAIDCGYMGNEGDPFTKYIDFLNAERIIGKDSKKWVDIIRKSGNDATHHQKSILKEEAERVMSLTATLLKIAYELRVS